MEKSKGASAICLLCFRLLSKTLKIEIPYTKSVVLSIVLYECESLSVVEKEEHRLRVFEDRVLHTVYGPKKEEVT
jgi:hypothetical protein